MDRPSFSTRRSVDSPTYAGSAAHETLLSSSEHGQHTPSFFRSASRSSQKKKEPARSPSQSHTHTLSASSSISSGVASRKSRGPEPAATEAHAEPASLSMPPPSSRHPLRRPRSSLSQSQSRRESSTSDAWSEDLSAHSNHELIFGEADDFESTPRLLAESETLPLRPRRHPPLHPQLPEPALAPNSSDSEVNKRVSISSMYSLASARGVSSSAASANGSDPGAVPRSVSGLMASSKGMGTPSQSEAGVSNVTVTTSSSAQHGGHAQSSGGGGHHLSPRDNLTHQHLDIIKRNTAATRTAGESQPQNGQGQGQTAMSSLRVQPHRSRSRVKRRFSNSTNAGSNPSPSSDRLREKEEAKPAPLGIIGVCALDIKARSRPSKSILMKFVNNREFDVMVFGDKVILDEKVEDWPICDYLICFYSEGFPLDKAIAYVKLRKPFCVNDVPMQKILWDRRLCLNILDKVGVPTPRRLEVSRDGGPAMLTPDVAQHIKNVSGVALEPTDPARNPPPRKVELLDDGDMLSVDGALLKKPFVEKPISGEDHNIVIYFPKSAGGGARKLFRKIGNKSSEFVPDLIVPRAITEPENSFVYEKFMQVDNAEDVKAYTVGPAYCHAETRKSPVVDGVVRRNTHGKEIRYITALDPDEKEIASKISTAFGQWVCGFDFLRAGGKSYVIDVNGWSFVKDNEEYYEQCATILKDIFIKERRRRGHGTPIPSPAISDITDPLARQMAQGKEREALQPNTGSVPPSKVSGSAASSLVDKPLLLLDPRVTDSRSASGATSSKSDSTPDPKVQASVSTTLPPPTADSVASAVPSTSPSDISTAPSAPQDSGPPADMPPPPLPKHTWKLKGMVSVIRHADRTPKQKYKFTFHTEPFIELLRGHQEEVLLIGEAALASVMDAVDIALKAGIEDRGKLKALRNVLAKKGGWAGTKVQIKPMFRKKKTEEMKALEESKAVVGMPSPIEKVEMHFPPASDAPTEALPVEVSTKREFEAGQSPGDQKGYTPRLPPRRHDSLSGVTMSRITAAEESLVLDKLQLIVKWGGEPTHSARYQSQELGENMRNDLMLLNRDILDEVHVYSSSERRVTTSAQIWTASFLGLKDLPENFIQIRKDLLDDSNAAKDEMDKVKKKLKGLLRKGSDRPSQFAWPDKMPEPADVQSRVVQLMNFHRRVMQHNYGKLYSGAVSSLNAISNPGGNSAENLHHDHVLSSSVLGSSLSQANAVNSIQARWCCGEDAELFRERWEKLFAEFSDAEKVDPSKISELYDTMKFDALHNRQFLEWVFTPPKSMLEEEYGPGKDGKATPKDSEDSGKASLDSSGDRSHTILANSSDKSEKLDSSNRAASVKRIFRRRSFLNGLRHIGEAAPPEQYFHLHRGNSQTKAKTDARFEPLRELYQLAKVLFDFICPQEYGISESEKLEIGLLTSLPLLKEIVQDLEEMQSSNDAKSFFYFTKESHIYTLLNCILEGGIETKIKRSTIPELDYLSQICFELYESETKLPDDAPSDEEPTFAYSIRITISPGCHVFDPLDVQLDSKHCIGCAPRRSLTSHGDWLQVIQTLRAKFNQVKLPKTFLAVNLSDAFSFVEQPESQHPDDVKVEQSALVGSTSTEGEEQHSQEGEIGESGEGDEALEMKRVEHRKSSPPPETSDTNETISRELEPVRAGGAVSNMED